MTSVVCCFISLSKACTTTSSLSASSDEVASVITGQRLQVRTETLQSHFDTDLRAAHKCRQDRLNIEL